MKKITTLSVFAAATLVLLPSVALANVSGTAEGQGATQQQAVGNGQLAVNRACSAYGGVQSSQLIQISYDSVYWHAYYKYTCNQ